MQLPTKRQVRPDALASELADAQVKANAEIAAARQRLAEKRESVITRATERKRAVNELQSELNHEEQALTDLIRAA